MPITFSHIAYKDWVYGCERVRESIRKNFVLLADLLLLKEHMVVEWWEKVAL